MRKYLQIDIAHIIYVINKVPNRSGLMKANEFEERHQYLISKGYTKEELDQMTLVQIFTLINKLVSIDKMKEEC